MMIPKEAGEVPVERVPSQREELANTVSHGLGAVLALAGAVVAIVVAGLGGDPFRITATAIYGTTLFLVFLSSALYHGLTAPRIRPVLMWLDHLCIYLLIAGTYTPFALVTLNGPWGWSLFGVEWGLASVGIVLRTLLGARFPLLFTGLYASMGWTGIVAAGPMAAAMPAGGLALIVGGGLAYTAGILFFVWRRLPYHHLVWHLFVLLGAALHYGAVLRYVAPA